MPTRIKVLQFIANLQVGGSEMELDRLVRGLDKEKFDVTVLTMYIPIGPIGKKLVEDGYKVETLGIRNKYNLLGALVQLKLNMRQNKYDVVQSWLFPDNLVARIACREIGTPLINGKRDTDRYKSAVRKFVDKQTQNMASMFVSNSVSGVNELCERGVPAGKITYIPNMIDLSRFKPSGPKLHSDKIIIGSVGRLSKQKGYEYLITAASKIRAVHEDVEFEIHGDGPERRRLEEMAKELHAPVRFFPNSKHEDMPLVYHNFDIFILSSLWEGTPNTLIEAMACGLPCIATDVDGSHELITDKVDGVLIQPKSSEHIVQAITEMIDYKDKTKAMGKGAVHTIRDRLDSTRTIHQFEELFERLTRQGI